MSMCLHIHSCFCCLCFVYSLAPFSFLAGRRIIYISCTPPRKRRSSKEIELKESADSHLSSESLAFYLFLHFLNFFEGTWGWIGMSSGKQRRNIDGISILGKQKCTFYISSLESNGMMLGLIIVFTSKEPFVYWTQTIAWEQNSSYLTSYLGCFSLSLFFWFLPRDPVCLELSILCLRKHLTVCTSNWHFRFIWDSATLFSAFH